MEMLASYLKHEAPRDVFMPCAKGSKAPLYPHKGDVWNWSDFDTFAKQHKSYFRHYDVGLLLKDLCVIDVDSVQQAMILERDFPELKSVPCEATCKGRHYFFRRSALADNEGFYDGPAQVERGIDFKTISQHGTSGFVVIAPSTGKKWIRFMTNLTQIGEDLLRRVAVPREATQDDIMIRFGDRPAVSISMRGLRHVDVFRSFIGQDALAGPVPLPGEFDEDSLMDLCDACQYGITRRVPTVQIVTDMLQLADFIGFPMAWRVVQSIRPGGMIGSLIDVHRHFPEMATALHAEMLYRVGKTDCQPSSTLDDVEVDVEITPERYLFGTPMISTPMPLRDELSYPEFVGRWLHEFPGELVLAGGGALYATVDCTPPGDYDFFMCGVSADRALEIARHVTGNQVILHVTAHAVTMSVDGILAQLILRRYDSVGHLLASFDIAPCKVALVSENGSIIARAMQTWKLSMATSTFVLDASMWGAASVLRILKYAGRGFHVFVPNLSRQHIRHGEVKGIAQLFDLEARRGGILPDQETLAQDLRVMFRNDRTLRNSDYDVFQQITKGVVGIMYWISHVLFGKSNKPVIDFVPLAPRASNFHARSPCWHSMYGPGWTKAFIAQLTDKVHVQQMFELPPTVGRLFG